jgi:hypothetical protein
MVLFLAANSHTVGAEKKVFDARQSGATGDRPAGWLNVRECGASGSRFETVATSEAGSHQIAVKDVGDFRVGQGVMLSQCNPHYTLQTIWGPRGAVAWGRKLDGKAEIRGYDGSQGDWMVLVLDVAKGSTSFRWTEDLARTWHPDVPISGDWQPLRDGIEVRLNRHDWDKGYTVVFAGRGQLVTVVDRIEGNKITLRGAPTRTAKDATLRHCDDAALQAAIDRAIKENRNVFVPVGHYRLSRGLRVRNAGSITIEGENAVDTVLDISDGEGACVAMTGGTEVTLRNFTMVGHSGFDRRDQCGHIPMRGSEYFWGFAAKDCNATTIGDTERVLIENCHGRRMASECFVAGGRSRGTPAKPNTAHTKMTTYLRCSAVDCGRNGFNDVMCGSENTSVLYCRIVDVGGCSWEGASRFVKFIGNYVRNSGTVAMGNLGPSNRDNTYPDLGAGQHIIADNVFESNVPYGGCAIRSASGATQVIVRNNLFVNFNSSAVEASGASDSRHFPSANTTIAGNLFDMTCVGAKSAPRIAIDVSANDTIVSDNQVYVRGPCDPAAAGIRLCEPALNVNVHDNLIRNCGLGIFTARGQGRIAEVLDRQTFTRTEHPSGLPLERQRPDLCRGWSIAWPAGAKPGPLSVIEAFDPETLRFRLKEPCGMKAGDRFEVIAPSTNWNLHANTISGCLKPVVLDSYGSETSLLTSNIVTRGETTGVTAAVEVRGMFKLIGNHISGFDEKGASAVSLVADPLGRTARSTYRDNVIQKCANAVKESQKGLWDAAKPGFRVD